MNLILIICLMQTATFESHAPGETTKISSEIGTFIAAKGHAEIQQQHVASGKQALHIFGGEQKSIRLKLRKALAAQTEVSFFAERWARRPPFKFTIEGKVGAKWVELYSGDGVAVGSFSRYSFDIEKDKIKELRFNCTSASDSGLLIDDITLAVPGPMQFVSSTTLQPTLPVLVANDINPVTTLEITTKGDKEPIKLKLIKVDLQGTSQLSDILQVDAVYQGQIVGSVKKIKDSKITIDTKLTLQRGTNSIQVSVQLKPSASLDRKVAACVTKYELSSAKGYMVPKQSADRQAKRIGLAIRDSGDAGSHTYRIPGLATTPKGTLIAVYDIRWENGGDLPGHIDVGMSRSVDGGHQWQEMQTIMDMGDNSKWHFDGVGDPCVLVDQQTGEIFVFALWSHGNRGWSGSGAGMSPEETGQLMVTSSKDDGKSWSKCVNITAQLKQPQWRLVLQGPGRGITMRDGTLVLPMQFRDGVEQGSLPSSFIAVSQDHGKTWTASTAPKNNTTEAQVVELSDGSLMLNMRDNRGCSRSVFVSDDLGKTWQEHATSRSVLQEPVCMASLINVPGRPRTLLFSNPNVSSAPRRNMTVKASLNDGSSWPANYQLLIDEGSSAGYSCMTMIDEQTIGILFEGSLSHLTFMRIPLQDLNLPAH